MKKILGVSIGINIILIFGIVFLLKYDFFSEPSIISNLDTPALPENIETQDPVDSFLKLPEDIQNKILEKDNAVELDGLFRNPEKNIYCSTGDIQYSLNYILLKNYESDIQTIIKDTDTIPDPYKDTLLGYLNDNRDSFTPDNPLWKVFDYMTDNSQEILNLIEKKDFQLIRKNIESLNLPPDEEIMFLLFAYKNNIPYESVISFFDSCYLYESEDRNYNFDYIRTVK